MASNVPAVKTMPAKPQSVETRISRVCGEIMLVMRAPWVAERTSTFLGEFTISQAKAGYIPQRRDIWTAEAM
jgi:hypothetical protein